MSILDLSESTQRKLAKEMGLSHRAWVEEMKRSLSRADEFLDQLKTKQSDLTQEQIEHMQAKMNSGNPVK